MKNKTEAQKAQARVKNDRPPRIEFKYDKTDILQRKWWIPVVYVANVAIPLDSRPFKGFKRNERDAVMTWITMALSEILFGHPKYLTNSKGQMQKNPDWVELPFYLETEGGEWIQHQLEKVYISQQQASDDNNPIVT